MARTRVKDMSRRQQKAVFANMTDAGYLRKLESAEQYKRRTEYLTRKHDLAEDTEDKLFDVWNSKKLTYRQKMSKGTAIKKEAAAKLKAYQKTEYAPTITGKIRATQEKRFAKKYSVAGIKKTDRASLEELEKGARYEYKTGDRITMETARRAAAVNLKKDPDYYKTREASYKQAKSQKYKVVLRLPAVGTAKAETVESDPMSKKEAEKLAHKKKKAGFFAGVVKAEAKKETIGIITKRGGVYKKKTSKKPPASKDTDKDGVPDHLDCEPKNPKKQDAARKTKKSKDAFLIIAAQKNSNRPKLYKDAYDTKQEAEDVADYLTHEEKKKDVFVFKDKDGVYNISYYD